MPTAPTSFASTAEPRATCGAEHCEHCPARRWGLTAAAAGEVPADCANRLERGVARRLLHSLWGDLRFTIRVREHLRDDLRPETPAALLHAVEEGRVIICRRTASPRIRTAPPAKGRPPPAEYVAPAPVEVETTWIEIVLVDMDCEPVPNERYRIVEPDGGVHEGRLNYVGRARVDGIEKPGQCKVSFPDLDRDAWRGDVTCPEVVVPPSLTFIEFQLVDMAGEPVAGECYRIKTPAGSVHDGFLNHEGRVRYEKILEGSYVISFPDLDADAWEAVPNA